MQIQTNPAKWKEPIKAAMVEAITMAETALDVINNNGNDGLVKNMISSILDDNHPEDLEYAKGKFPPSSSSAGGLGGVKFNR